MSDAGKNKNTKVILKVCYLETFFFLHSNNLGVNVPQTYPSVSNKHFTQNMKVNIAQNISSWFEIQGLIGFTQYYSIVKLISLFLWLSLILDSRR